MGIVNCLSTSLVVLHTLGILLVFLPNLYLLVCSSIILTSSYYCFLLCRPSMATFTSHWYLIMTFFSWSPRVLQVIVLIIFISTVRCKLLVLVVSATPPEQSLGGLIHWSCCRSQAWIKEQGCWIRLAIYRRKTWKRSKK